MRAIHGPNNHFLLCYTFYVKKIRWQRQTLHVETYCQSYDQG